MNARNLVAFVAGVAALVGGLAAFQQHARVADLERQRTSLEQSRATAATQPVAKPVLATNQLSEKDKLELLRLRGEVTRLRERQRELAGVKAENQALRARAGVKGTNAVGAQIALPPGYVRRQDAQFVGQATPEAALQSFFWAIQNRDTNTLLRVLDDRGGQEMWREMERQGEAKFWEGTGIIPGFRVVGSEPRSDSEVVLKVEIMPGDNSQNMTVRLVANEWKLQP